MPDPKVEMLMEVAGGEAVGDGDAGRAEGRVVPYRARFWDTPLDWRFQA